MGWGSMGRGGRGGWGPIGRGGRGGWGAGDNPFPPLAYRDTCAQTDCQIRNFVEPLASLFCQTGKLINPGIPRQCILDCIPAEDPGL
eukprot:1159704-Pelagomonas_calceolata.AAC.2